MQVQYANWVVYRSAAIISVVNVYSYSAVLCCKYKLNILYTLYMLAIFYDCPVFYAWAYFVGVFCYEANPNFYRNVPTLKLSITWFKKDFTLISLTVFSVARIIWRIGAHTTNIFRATEKTVWDINVKPFYKSREREFECGFVSMKIWICLIP